VRKKVEVRTKARRPRKVEVTIRGFKVWYLMDVETGLPMAMTLDTINTPDTEHVRPLIDQALANLKGHCRLVSVALDRGFLDGDLLWWLKQARGLDWYCPAKEKMSVTAEARQRVFAVLSAQQSANEGPSATARRLARQGEEHDSSRFSEQGHGPGRDTLVVAQVDGLLCTDFYGPGGSSSSRLNSKSYEPTPLHATVVLNWPDRSAQDRQDVEEHDEVSDEPVVLLSPVVEPALVRFDRYQPTRESTQPGRQAVLRAVASRWQGTRPRCGPQRCSLPWRSRCTGRWSGTGSRRWRTSTDAASAWALSAIGGRRCCATAAGSW